MPWKLMTLPIALALLGAFAALAAAQSTAADLDARVAKFASMRTEDLTANAPQPDKLPQDIKLTLIDFIDCAADKLHPFMSDGHDNVVAQAPAAPEANALPRYRQTGSHAGSYFAWRLRVAEANRPHLLVLEFPDNTDRMTALSLSEPPSANADNGLAAEQMKMEFGYRTGDLLPLSNRMITASVVFYPTSAEPAALLVANWHARMPAALSRIWVYTIDQPLPPAFAPGVKLHRQAGRYDDLPTALQHRYGGRTENLLAQLDYLGLGELALLAMDNRDFYYPSSVFGSGHAILPQIMASLEPSGKRLIAVFDPDCTTGVFTMPGQDRNMANMADSRARAAWTDFIVKDFATPLKDSPALGGVMFGGPRGAVGTDLEAGSNYNQFITHLSTTVTNASRALRVYQNLGPATPQDHYLRQASGAGLIQRWAEGRAAMDDLQRQHMAAYLSRYGLGGSMGNPTTVLLRGSEIDDAAYYRFYRSTEPRYWMLDAISRSRRITQALLPGSRLNGMLLNHVPQVRLINLHAGRDFWWDYNEISPTLPPVGQHLLAPLTLALASQAEPFLVWFGGQGSQTALKIGRAHV